MTYSSQSVIQYSDYNQLVWGSTSGGALVTTNNNINYIWGPGYGNRGLNQDMSSIIGLPNNQGSGSGYNDTIGYLSPVTTAQTITAQQWIGFLSALNRALYHQNQSNVSIATAPGFDRTIEVIASVQTYLNSAASGTGSTRGYNTRPIPNGAKSFPWIVANTASNQSKTFNRACYWPTGNDARWLDRKSTRLNSSHT